jgi:hypothetical protein
MSFFSTRIRPFFRTLAVIASCMGTTLLVLYFAYWISAPSPESLGVARRDEGAKESRPSPTAEELASERDRNLYGYGYTNRYRIGSILEFGDMSMLCSFRSDFMVDFQKEFGSRINTEELPAPSADLVVTAILRPLTLRLREAGTDEEVLRPIVEYIGLKMLPDRTAEWRYWKLVYKYWQDAQGFWSMDIVTDFKEAEQLRANRADIAPDEAAYRDALRRIPKAFAFYFDSLTAERTRAIKLMDELLALPEAERKPLNAIAKYRRARLKMSLEDWAALSDAEAKQRLADIRTDLSSVPTHAKEGSLDPAQLSDNAQYWIAYTRSMILPTGRLVRLGEADFKGALSTYLRMPIRDQGNAVNSSYHMARKLCAEKNFAGCEKDPDLRRVITLYLAAGGSNNSDMHLSHAEAKEISEAWLDALSKADVDPSFDPARIAMLQYVCQRWVDCLRTLALLPTDDPLRLLLASRCNLRLTGDLQTSRRILDPSTSAQSAAQFVGVLRPIKPTNDDAEFTTLIDFNEKSEMAERATAEKGIMALCHGDFIEALSLFSKAGFLSESDYVSECLVTTDELKGFVDKLDKDRPKDWQRSMGIVRSRLASRLFRDGRMEEALEYVSADLAPKARTYVILLRLAERTDIADRARADAYWRAALIIGDIGETILRAPIGLSWSADGSHTKPDSNWYVGYGFLPYHRLNKEREYEHAQKHTLIAPAQDEVRRINSWLDGHVEKPVRSERDARYATFDLALKAARLLPNNDPAGGQILQYAGNLLKYRERKAANPAYVLLVTRFKQTPYGEHALKRNWFSKETPEPSADIIAK